MRVRDGPRRKRRSGLHGVSPTHCRHTCRHAVRTTALSDRTERLVFSVAIIRRWLGSARKSRSASRSGKETLEDVYDLLRDVHLGSGNFAEVFKGKLKSPGRKFKKDGDGDGPATGEYPAHGEVAIKIIDKAKVEDMNDITREIEIMQSISHPHVVQLYAVFDEPKKVNLVMEYVSGGEVRVAAACISPNEGLLNAEVFSLRCMDSSLTGSFKRAATPRRTQQSVSTKCPTRSTTCTKR